MNFITENELRNWAKINGYAQDAIEILVKNWHIEKDYDERIADISNTNITYVSIHST